MTVRQKRGYSREFPTSGRRYVISIDYVPSGLFQAARRKAKTAGVSLRVLLLRWLTNWVAGRRPDEEGAA